jgi:zinc/manganese transport system substrate-binding protein
LYQPTPADARLLRAADLVVSNGLGFEGWIDRFVHAAEFEGDTLVASTGIEPLHIEVGERQEVDPHAWQSIANVRTYVNNISAALQQARPEHAAWFAARAAAYQQELDVLATEIHEALAQLPPTRRSIVTSHDAFGYFGREHQLRFLAPMGLSTDSEASARDLSSLIRQIRAERIGAVFIENISDPRLMQRITGETGARMGGVLYSDALSAPDGPAATYTAMIRHNLHTLMAALLPEPIMENPHD